MADLLQLLKSAGASSAPAAQSTPAAQVTPAAIGQLSGSVIDADLINQAVQIGDFLTRHRAQAKDRAKQERISPVVTALQQYAGNYNTAQTDEQRQQANAMANQIRANYAAGGGSFTDLPTKYWGADPTQGVQTTGGYQSPVSGYEGLGRKDTIGFKRQALLDALTQRVQEAGLTGIDPKTGEKTWDRQLQEMQYALSAAKGSGGGGYSATDIKNLNMADSLRKIKSKVDKAWADGGGWAGAVDAIPNIVAEIQANKPFYTTGGVNTDDVVDYVYEVIGGFIKKGGKWVPDDGTGSESNYDELMKELLGGNPQ